MFTRYKGSELYFRSQSIHKNYKVESISVLTSVFTSSNLQFCYFIDRYDFFHELYDVQDL